MSTGTEVTQDLCNGWGFWPHYLHEAENDLRKFLVCILAPTKVSCFLLADGSRGHRLGNQRSEHSRHLSCLLYCRFCLLEYFCLSLDESDYEDTLCMIGRRAAVVKMWLPARGNSHATSSLEMIQRSCELLFHWRHFHDMILLHIALAITCFLECYSKNLYPKTSIVSSM